MAKAAIDLGLNDHSRMNDGLGLCQLVGQVGVDITSPRKAAGIGDALVVNNNDGDALGRQARCAGAADVVQAALQRTDPDADLT